MSMTPLPLLPFVILIVAMALGPLVAEAAWNRHQGKIALGLGALAVAYYLLVLRRAGFVAHIAGDYVSFIVLIVSLFVVSGGIHISVKGVATPSANVLFLLIGAVMANVLGTTGAAMLLIRPWIRMNKYRITAHHIVFFIFIVANVGGSLSSVGDPPLFIGYLQGVPFWWITQKAWPVWLVAVAFLLGMFYLLDRRNYLRAPREVRERETPREEWKFSGLGNAVWLAVVLGAIAVDHPSGLRAVLMAGAAAASYFTTPRHVHEANHFDLGPVRDLTFIFAGIFATMMPVLDWLGANARGLLGVHPHAATFFWSAGGLSSVLDNAPTYLAYFRALSGATGAPNTAHLLVSDSGSILAISIGAVFFGGATYIGNGPNLMVKAIADHQGVHMPSFLGFVGKYSLPLLLPVLGTVWLIFFSS
jgi:Na+/H+ antiporter NhaD/arsenite permease-like protein